MKNLAAVAAAVALSGCVLAELPRQRPTWAFYCVLARCEYPPQPEPAASAPQPKEATQ